MTTFSPQPKPARERKARKVTPALQRVYDLVHEQACLACGARPVEAHHLHGIASLSVPGQLVRRGHTGLAAYAVIPLCASCHRGDRGVHAYHSEAAWFDARVNGGHAIALATAMRYLAQALDEVAA